MSSDPAMIEISGVTKRFGGFTAVDNVSLEVRAGEFLTLLGPSGCGKTTLLRMIAGFETPEEGAILLGGEDVTYLAPYRRNVNQVFQSYALFPHLNVRDNIAFGLRMQKCPDEEIAKQVADAVALVSLEGFEHRMPTELSGGQRQRVALARALAPKPKVLLLDEPLSALDAKLRASMQIELKRLQRQLGMTFVFVTHDQEEALTMSDRIAVMNKGRVEQFGTSDEIYHQPKTAFVAEFIGEANLLTAEMVSHNGTTGCVRLEGGLELTIALDKWPVGSKSALVSIRPEKVHISRHPVEAEIIFSARVMEELFQGALDRLWLECDAGTQLMVLEANESSLMEAIHEGDRVYCGLHADDIVVVRTE